MQGNTKAYVIPKGQEIGVAFFVHSEYPYQTNFISGTEITLSVNVQEYHDYHGDGLCEPDVEGSAFQVRRSEKLRWPLIVIPL